LYEARDAANELMDVGRKLHDPRSTGLGLWLLAAIAVASESYSEALEYSEQALAVAVTPNDKFGATRSKGIALILLRRTEEGVELLENDRRRCTADGCYYSLALTDGAMGVGEVLRGHVGSGIKMLQRAIEEREKEGYRAAADWYRVFLSEVYWQIAHGEEKPSFPVILRNMLPILGVLAIAPNRIVALMTHVLKNPHYDHAGFHVGRARMLLGLGYQLRKKRNLALEHLTEDKRILSQFGQTPILARVDTALAEFRK
jgi:hypothetical protein